MPYPNHPPGDEIIRQIAKRSPRVFLSFSRGKDSIAAWLKMRGQFEEIVPVFMYAIPGGLSFENESLDYYEKFFQTRIVRVPNPSFYRKLNAFVFQSPDRIRVIQAAGFKSFTRDDLYGWLAKERGMESSFNAIGLRLTDNLARRAMLTKTGPVNEKRKTFCPIWDMNKAQLVECIRESGCKLPADYRVMQSSFDGLSYRFLKPIKTHFPADYQKILEWFPLAEAMIFRHERCYA